MAPEPPWYSADVRGCLAGRVLCLVGLLIGVAPVLAEGDAAYQFALAKMHAAEGEFPEAIQAFKAAIELQPGDPYIRLEFAEFLSRTGRSRQAADEAEKALALDADNLDSLRSVGQIRLELASRDPRSLDIAKSTFERLRELASTERRSLMLLAALRSVYVALGSFACATLVSLLASALAAMDTSTAPRFFGIVGLAAGLVALAALVHCSIMLVRETRIVVEVLQERAAHIRARSVGGR